MGSREYAIASVVLRLLGWLFARFPVRRNRVVLATARLPVLEGNLLHIERAIRRLRPDVELVELLEPYSYGLGGKIRYLLRLVRGMYYLRTSSLVVVDNAWLPVHVAPHDARTTVVQVWHAAGALKRFGVDVAGGLEEPEKTFLHRYYDVVVAPGDRAREPWGRALRTPLEQVVALGSARTDIFFDAAALDADRAAILRRHPTLEGRRIVLYAPTFRGRGRRKRGTTTLDGAALRAALPADDALVIKTHPNLDATGMSFDGYDVVADPADDMNAWLAAADILVTDYSSSIFEWALLRRPLVLLVDDLDSYERDPGLYLDYRTEMIGVQVTDTDGVARAILAGNWNLASYATFIERYLGACDGHASERVVERLLPR